MGQKFRFISKAIYFPAQRILAFGDLHLGYGHVLKQEGIIFPFNQLEQTKKGISEIFAKLKKQGQQVKKIILLGDIKHQFGFDIGEKSEIQNFLKFLLGYISEKEIILIKGNHDKIPVANKKHYNFYIEGEIAFIHGNRWFKELENREIKTIVMGHSHPAVILKEPAGIKREKFKCFLVGNYKNKQFIIAPSFLPLKEGSEINEFRGDSWNSPKRPVFSIIPKNRLKNFEVLIVGEDKIFSFGKVRYLN